MSSPSSRSNIIKMFAHTEAAMHYQDLMVFLAKAEETFFYRYTRSSRAPYTIPRHEQSILRSYSKILFHRLFSMLQHINLSELRNDGLFLPDELAETIKAKRDKLWGNIEPKVDSKIIFTQIADVRRMLIERLEADPSEKAERRKEAFLYHARLCTVVSSVCTKEYVSPDGQRNFRNCVVGNPGLWTTESSGIQHYVATDVALALEMLALVLSDTEL